MYEKFAELLAKNNKTTYRVSKDTSIPQNVFSNWKTGKASQKRTNSKYWLTTLA